MKLNNLSTPTTLESNKSLEKLRETRLHDASMSAREAYTAILPGGNTALLPKKIRELVVLGLLRTIEDPL